MKKVIAFLLAVLYFVFTTFTLWQRNEDNRFIHTAYEPQKHVLVIADAGVKKAPDFDRLAAKSVSKPAQHLSVSGKMKLPRASSADPAYRNFLSFSTYGYQKLDIRLATPLLYHSSIYLKNGVLRI